MGRLRGPATCSQRCAFARAAAGMPWRAGVWAPAATFPPARPRLQAAATVPAPGAARHAYKGLGDALASIIRTEGSRQGGPAALLGNPSAPDMLRQGTPSHRGPAPPGCAARLCCRGGWPVPRRARQHAENRGGLGGAAGGVRWCQGPPAAPPRPAWQGRRRRQRFSGRLVPAAPRRRHAGGGHGGGPGGDGGGAAG